MSRVARSTTIVWAFLAAANGGCTFSGAMITDLAGITPTTQSPTSTTIPTVMPDVESIEFVETSVGTLQADVNISKGQNVTYKILVGKCSTLTSGSCDPFADLAELPIPSDGQLTVTWNDLGISQVDADELVLGVRLVDSNGIPIRDYQSRRQIAVRKTNMNHPETLYNSYSEAWYTNSGAVWNISRNTENGSYDGMFFNQQGIFHLSSRASYTDARVSSGGRYVMYLASFSFGSLGRDTIHLFDSITKTDRYLGYGHSASTQMGFSDDLTKVYWAARDSSTDIGLYTANIDGSNKQKLVTMQAAEWEANSIAMKPDNTMLAFSAPKAGSGLVELYKINADGSSLVKLSGTMVANGDVSGFNNTKVTDSKVVFLADRATNDVWELWSVNWDGTGLTALSGTILAGGDAYDGFLLNPDGSKAIFLADRETNDKIELWSVSLDGTALTKINTPLSASADVKSLIGWLGDSIVYSANRDVATVNEVFASSIDGALSFKTHPDVLAGGAVQYIEAAANLVTDRFVTLTKNSSAEAFELYSIKDDGTDLKKISVALTGNEYVSSALRARLQDKVYYLVTNSDDSTSRIYKVDANGANSTLLNTVSSTNLELHELTSDETKLVISIETPSYSIEWALFDLSTNTIGQTAVVADGDHRILEITHVAERNQTFTKRSGSDTCGLYSWSNGMSNWVDLLSWKVSGGCVASYSVQSTIGDTLIRGSLDTVGKNELYLSKSGTATSKDKLNGTVNSSIDTFSISSNYQHLVYVGDSAVAGNKELWYVDLASTPRTPTHLSGAITTTATISTAMVRDQGDYALVSGKIGSTKVELFQINLATAGRVKINPALVASPNRDLRFYTSPSFSNVVFFAQTAASGFNQLYSVAATSTTPTQIGSGFNFYENDVPLFSPNETRILARGNGSGNNYMKAHVISLDGSSSVNLSSLFAANHDPLRVEWIDNDWVLISGNLQDLARDELFKVKADGSTFLKVNGTLFDDEKVENYELSPTLGKIVYLADQENGPSAQLYAYDCSTDARTKLSQDLTAGQKITSMRILEDKNSVMYRVINQDLSDPRWYIINLATGVRRALFQDLVNDGYYLGDFLYNTAFNAGVLSLRKDSNSFQLFRISF